MSHADADGPEPEGRVSIPPPAAIPFPRTDDTAHIDVECTLGEYYVTVWSEREGDNEPAELSASEGAAFAEAITERSALVARLNGS